MRTLCIFWTLILTLWAAALPAQTAQSELFGVDLDSWERLANRADAVIETGRASEAALLTMRSQIVAWRRIVENALEAPKQKLDRLALQLEALGPESSEGQPPDSPEVEERRLRLNEEIGKLGSDFSIGNETVHRAERLISEIDALRRTMKRTELLSLGPTPLNPLIWLGAFKYLAEYAKDASGEVVDSLSVDSQRRYALNNALQSLFLAVLGILLLSRFRFWAVRSIGGEVERRSGVYHRAWSFIAGFLTSAALPAIGLFLVVEAAETTGLHFVKSTMLLEALPFAGLYVFGARWIADASFGDSAISGIALEPDPRWRQSAHLTGALAGWVLGVDYMIDSVIGFDIEASVEAVLKFPAILAGAYLLFKFGRLYAKSSVQHSATDSGIPVRARILGLLGKAAIAIGALAAILSVVGYGAAAEYLVFPSILTLYLLGFVSLITMLLGGLYLAATRKPEETLEDGRSLFTAMIALLLFLLSLPVIAWLWGTTEEELLDFWDIALEGVHLGGQQISISDLVTLVVVFIVGFALTKFAKSVLESTILPNTNFDEGGRKAIATGTGYVGIFIAAVVAVSLAGIDLTNLAIVAGALSVGIGFGLQTIVSNFVSGLILLIERPVNEGDWIVVGSVSGTIRNISVRSTTIETFDRANVIVPNSDLISSTVTNWTLKNRYGRSIIPVGVAYGTDPRKVERLLLHVALANDKVMKNPEPQVMFMGFGDSSLNFELRVILVDVNYLLSAKSELNFAIAEIFKEEGIEIPFPQRDLWIRNPEAIGEGLRNKAGKDSGND